MVENTGPPYLDALEFKVIPDAATQMAALESNDVDVIFINQPSHMEKVEQDENVELYETVLNSLIYLGFNYQKPPFDEKLVRQALSHAVDKDQVVELALGGLGVAAYAPLPPTLPGFDESLKEYELGYDPDKAAALLEEAGLRTNERRRLAAGRRTAEGRLADVDAVAEWRHRNRAAEPIAGDWRAGRDPAA